MVFLLKKISYLHNISISSQEVEQVEREDESASFNKPVKIKGKAKPRKVMELETKPSPFSTLGLYFIYSLV
jgi:hypothetical protein